MRIADAQWIPSTQHQTWDALTDPAVLQRCIPGCVNVTQRSPPSTPSPCVPRSPASTPTTTARSCCRTSIPNSCTLVFEGKGRAAWPSAPPRSTSAPGPGHPRGLHRGGHDRRQAGRMRREPDPEGGREDHRALLRRVHRLHGRPATAGAAAPPPEPEPRGLSNSRWSWALVLVVIAVFLSYHTPTSSGQPGQGTAAAIRR